MQKLEAQQKDLEKQCKLLKKHLLYLAGDAKAKDYTPPADAKLPRDVMGCKKKLAETKLRLDKHNMSMKMKDDNKCVALGTSKMNYMDPRITVGWCKKVD